MERDQRGAELLRLRLEAGLSQGEVGERAGISQSNIAAYEAGRRPMSEDMFERIGRAMRRRPSEVLRVHRAEVEGIAVRHGATAVRVFGSVARGEEARQRRQPAGLAAWPWAASLGNLFTAATGLPRHAQP